MGDLITLGEIAARTSVLEVACSRCERRGRYRLDKLIARYGDGEAREMIPELTADCPKRGSASLMERCDVLFLGLAKLFYVQR
jgi:hypothetical protein